MMMNDVVRTCGETTTSTSALRDISSESNTSSRKPRGTPKREISSGRSTRSSSRRKKKTCSVCGTSDTTMWRKISKDSNKLHCDTCAREQTTKKRKRAIRDEDLEDCTTSSTLICKVDDDDIPVDSLLFFSRKPLVDVSLIPRNMVQGNETKKKKKKKKQKMKKKKKKKKNPCDRVNLNTRLKKLKSRFKNIFKFRIESNESEEDRLQWYSCASDEWNDVCGKKRECGRSTCTFCIEIKNEEKKKINDSLDDFISSSDERNCDVSKKKNVVEEISVVEEEEDGWKNEYTIAVRNILFTNVSMGKPGGKKFWFRVRQELLNIFPDIEELSASEIRTQWTKRSQKSIQDPKKKTKSKDTPILTLARKGTLKRRRQMRQKMEELDADHMDDVFGEEEGMMSPTLSKKLNIDQIVVDSPQLPSSLDCSSPENSVLSSPDLDLLRPVNHGAYDAYIHKRDKGFRRGRRKDMNKNKNGSEKKKKSKKSISQVVRGNKIISATSRDASGRTIRGCVTPSGSTKIRFQNDDSFDSLDGMMTNNNNNRSCLSDSDISDIALTPMRASK